MLYVCRLIILLSCILTPTAFAVQELPQAITVQGRLMNAAGTAALTGPVALTLSVLDHNQECVLFEETHAAVTLTDGMFSISLGDGSRSDTTGYSFAQIFANNGVALNNNLTGATCSGTYTPASGDVRYLKISVGGTTLSSNLKISAVPFAVAAETLNGKGISDLILVAGNVTQANLDTLTGAGDASALHHHDSLYLKVNSSTNYNVGSSNIYTNGKMFLGTGAAAPVAASPMLEIQNSSDIVGVRVHGNSAQTEALQQWFNSDGTAMVTVAANGGVTARVTAGGAEGLMGVSSGALGKGIVGQADNSGYGVYGTSTNGYGVFGTSVTGYGGFFYSTGNSVASLAARAGTSGDIQQWLNSDGTAVASVNSAGKFTGDGSSLTGITATDSSKVAKTGDTMTGALVIDINADTVPLKIQGHSTQTSSMQMWINSDGTAMVNISGDGTLGLLRSANGFNISTVATSSAGSAFGAFVGGGVSASNAGTDAALQGVNTANGGVAIYGFSTGTGSTAARIYNAASGNAIHASAMSGHAGFFESVDATNTFGTLVTKQTGAGTNDLFQALNADGTALVRIDKSGKIYGDGSQLSNLASGFADPMTTRGDIIFKNSGGTTTRLPAGGANTVLQSDGTDISYSAITNDHVSATAGIAFSKMEDVTSGKILVGSAGNKAAAVSMSGDATIDNTGAVTAAAAIARRTADNTFTKQNIITPDSDTVGLIVRGYDPSQTSDIMQIRNAEGTAIYSFEQGGSATASIGVATKAYVSSSTPTSLSNYVKRDGTSSFTSYIDVDGIAEPAVSAAGKGRIYFDSTDKVFKVSNDGGAFANLSGTDSTKVAKAGDTMTSTLTIDPATDVPALKIAAEAGQTSALQEWIRSDGTAGASMSSTGILSAASVASTSFFASNETDSGIFHATANLINNGKGRVLYVQSAGSDANTHAVYVTTSLGVAAHLEAGAGTAIEAIQSSSSSLPVIKVQSGGGTGPLQQWLDSNGTALATLHNFNGTAGYRLAISDNGGACYSGICTGGGLSISSDYGTGLYITGNSAMPAISIFAQGGDGIVAISTGANTSGIAAASFSGASGYFRSAANNNTTATLIVQRNGSQTADMFQVRNNAGTATARITNNGFVANAKYKSANKTITNSDALEDDNHLVGIPIPGTGKYRVYGTLFASSASATPDIKIAINVATSTVNNMMIAISSGRSGATTAGITNYLQIANGTATGGLGLGSSTYQMIYIDGTIDVTNEGTVNLKWAQNAANANGVILYQGSYLGIQPLE